MSAPVTIIAEVGSVHDGSFGNARRLVHMAAERGVDAVKFQTHVPADETTRDAPPPPYFSAEPRFAYFERTGFTRAQWETLQATCQEAGVEFLSSVFSVAAVDLLEEVGVARHKIPSGEVTNLPLLERVAATKKPVLLSSGMSSWEELDAAMETLRSGGAGPITLLQCTSAYPCPHDRVGLNVLAEMRARYGCPVGLSDHTLDNYASFAAVALGAVALERHITFSRCMYGSDAAHSLEPPELADLVRGVRAIEAMLAAPVDKADVAPYRDMKAIYEKSVVARRDVAAGTVLAAEDLAVKRPGTGIPAARLAEVIGRRAANDLSEDALITTSDLEPPLP